MNPPQARSGMSRSAGSGMLLFVLGVLVLYPLMLEPEFAHAARGLGFWPAAWALTLFFTV